MMNWVYPDTPIENPNNTIKLDLAKNSREGFQILTDLCFDNDVEVAYSHNGEVNVTLFQLLPVTVNANCGKELFTTMDYEEVKDFVTRKAPFDIYEVCRPLTDGVMRKGRAAFFVKIDVDADAKSGEYNDCLTVTVGDKSFNIPFSYKIYSAVIPSAENATVGMNNWLFYHKIVHDFNVKVGSKDYEELVENFIQSLLDIRSNYLMLPPLTPVIENGKVVDFDYSETERVANIAIKKGFKRIVGDFAVKWKNCFAEEIYLKWNMDIDAVSDEGIRQLRLYFAKCAELLEKNKWGEKYLQGVMDEVEVNDFHNYEKVVKIFREYLPNVKINDPVEFAEAGKLVNVMVPKQVAYEREIESFQKEQEKGRDVWVYTCAFPAGKAMKRILDLPLTATRLPLWLCYKYGLKGFLCWGYNWFTEDPYNNTCFKEDGVHPLPAGDNVLVYPGENNMPWQSLRAHVQRAAVEDNELLYLLGKKDKKLALKLVDKLCRSFTDYETEPNVFYSVRKEVLENI